MTFRMNSHIYTEIYAKYSYNLATAIEKRDLN